MDNPRNGIVSNLAFGGEGIVRTEEGFVVFIPFCLPQEEVAYQIEKKKKNFAKGRLLEVLRPSDERVIPPCRHYGECGGCQLQHLSYKGQVAYKEQMVKEALVRLGEVKEPFQVTCSPSAQEWGYRRHISLRFRVENGKATVGYSHHEDASFLPVNACPIFSPLAPQVFEEAKKVLGLLFKEERQEGRISLYKTEEDGFVAAIHADYFDKKGWEALQKEKSPFFQSILAQAPGPKLGKSSLALTFEGLQLAYSPLAFVQNHPEQSAAIYRYLFQAITHLQPKKVLDLYCGLGILSLLLAREGIQTDGIDFNREGIALARQNALENNLEGASFFAAKVEDVIQEALNELGAPLITLNPPREGLHEKVVEAINNSQVTHLFYTSCMPPTLARDMKRFQEGGFSLENSQAFDMFPQTYHVETVVLLTRSLKSL